LSQLPDRGDVDAIAARDAVIGLARLEPDLDFLLLLRRQLLRFARYLRQPPDQAAFVQDLRGQQGAEGLVVGLVGAVLDFPFVRGNGLGWVGTGAGSARAGSPGLSGQHNPIARGMFL
jgi:hypothetical protein